MNFTSKLDTYFEKAARGSKYAPTQALVWSAKNKLDYTYSGEQENQPFHIASIGKMMTASLVGIVSRKGQLTIDDPISNYLADDIISGLFVYDGVDYKNQVTIRQLLSHTSGIADYFEDKTKSGPSFVKRMMSEPSKVWSSQDLIDFTRNNQSAKSAPGTFSYSDSGYILLGLIIENVTNMPFAKALSTYIFKPLSMKDSYLLFGGTPIHPKREIAKVWFNKKEISTLNMLSCDWAGGGVVSTVADLLKFQKAFWDNKIVDADFKKEMITSKYKFRAGIHYGNGTMELQLEGFFFLLRNYSRLVGHSGILGTTLFYDTKTDTHIILNFGSNRRVVESFRAVIFIKQLIDKTR